MAKNKGGRPSKYDPKYCLEIIKFFSVEFFQEKVMEKKTEYQKDGSVKSEFEKRMQIATPLRFLSQFARKIGVNQDTLHEWASKHPEFSEALKEAKELQKEHLITCGLKGLFNPSFAIFSTKNMIGWRDEQYLKGAGENGEFVVTVEIADENNASQESRNRISEYVSV